MYETRNLFVGENGAFILSRMTYNDRNNDTVCVRSSQNTIHKAYAGGRAHCNQRMRITGALRASSLAYGGHFCEKCFSDEYAAKIVAAAKLAYKGA